MKHRCLQHVQKGLQQGRREAHGAMNKERHVCARRRVGEATVSCSLRRVISPALPEPAKTGSCSRGRYVEGLSDARTQLKAFFNILLKVRHV